MNIRECNLVPRVLWLLGQRIGAHPLTKMPEDSGNEIAGNGIQPPHGWGGGGGGGDSATLTLFKFNGMRRKATLKSRSELFTKCPQLVPSALNTFDT